MLSGPMGAGKTSVGAALATLLERPFVDLDARIAAAAGLSIAAIFATRGEAAFRGEEQAALRSALAGEPPAVIAVGGGALVDASVRERVLRACLVVGLSAAPDVLAARVALGVGRPLLRQDGAPLAQQLAAIMRERELSYGATHLAFETSVAPAAEVAARVAAELARGVFPVTVSSTSAYSARRADACVGSIAADALDALGPTSIAIVTDDNVARLHLAALRKTLAERGYEARSLTVLPAGEPEKTLAAVERVVNALSDAGCDRRSVVIGFGGGMVTDIAGFAASIFARGVRWLALPTTLLGMVDAAIGGKTAVNLVAAKNAIGTFHQPAAVIVDTSLSATEEPRAVRSGLAEVVKSALVADAALFAAIEALVERLAARDADAIARVVDGALAIKCQIVSDDPEERGRRVILNFGHTLGHGLEAATDYATYAHGEAVAIGMVAATRFAVASHGCPAEVAQRLERLLSALGLPTEPPESILESALGRIATDKKRLGGKLSLVLPSAVGNAGAVSLSVDACSDGLRRTLSAPVSLP